MGFLGGGGGADFIFMGVRIFLIISEFRVFRVMARVKPFLDGLFSRDFEIYEGRWPMKAFGLTAR